MKRTVISAAVLALGLAGAGVSLADPGDNGQAGPGHGNNTWGLCNAYSHNGGNNQGVAFQKLEEAAHEYDQNTGNEYDNAKDEVAKYCGEFGQKPGGGNK